MNTETFYKVVWVVVYVKRKRINTNPPHPYRLQYNPSRNYAVNFSCENIALKRKGVYARIRLMSLIVGKNLRQRLWSSRFEAEWSGIAYNFGRVRVVLFIKHE